MDSAGLCQEETPTGPLYRETDRIASSMADHANTDHIVDLHRHRAELAVSHITEIYHSDRIRSLAILLALYRGGKDKRNVGAYIMARLPTRVRNDLQLNLTFISRTAPTFYEILGFGKPTV